MKRPPLEEVPLNTIIFGGVSPCVNILICREEWSEWIQTAYDAGHNIIEFDENEIAVRAFQKTIIQPGLFTKDEREEAGG